MFSAVFKTRFLLRGIPFSINKSLWFALVCVTVTAGPRAVPTSAAASCLWARLSESPQQPCASPSPLPQMRNRVLSIAVGAGLGSELEILHGGGGSASWGPQTSHFAPHAGVPAVRVALVMGGARFGALAEGRPCLVRGLDRPIFLEIQINR